MTLISELKQTKQTAVNKLAQTEVVQKQLLEEEIAAGKRMSCEFCGMLVGSVNKFIAVKKKSKAKKKSGWFREDDVRQLMDKACAMIKEKDKKKYMKYLIPRRTGSRKLTKSEIWAAYWNLNTVKARVYLLRCSVSICKWEREMKRRIEEAWAS